MSCCKLEESTNETGRCETCQGKIQKRYIERLRCKNERQKQERFDNDNPDKFREREPGTEKQAQRR